MAGYSAVAYSIFVEAPEDSNFAPGEVAIRLLILRDLDRLREYAREWLTEERNSDAAVSTMLADPEQGDIDEAIAVILNTTVCRALAFFDFALQTGEDGPMEEAKRLLSVGVELADDAGNVPLWWMLGICRHLINDLWEHSLHRNLPVDGPEGGAERYPKLHNIFIGSLYSRKVAEVELWPSQREAAGRASDLSDDLVVALPTSAGKTRVAEIAALMTLSTTRRVLIVTPLRALSAQTERSFRKTFGPLGFSVSSLYGASGVSADDEDALRKRSIVIATPEKLDFTLRSNPKILDDVGLIVLDEGHMIGPSEREIRFEVLVQRLLRRGDAADRRIVCLSAVLPSGDELDELTAWIRDDQQGKPVRTDWRPTRQRYGMLVWQVDRARLTLDLNENVPFINGFVMAKPPRGRDRKPYPRKASELALFAAWEFAAQGKRTLIYCTQARWVEGYGKSACEFVEKGYLGSLLDDEAEIARAVEIGSEWLGPDHPAVECLRIGVAVHHGKLPSPFLRELEILLAQGVIKVFVASPTLSQGLNLNAAVLLVPSLARSGKPISGEEFANVAGRAGRAFVDVEGQVIHVMYDRIPWRLGKWRQLVRSAKARTLKSGIIQVLTRIIDQLSRQGAFDRDDVWEYLANSREAWRSDEEESEDAATDQDGEAAEAGAEDGTGKDGGDDDEDSLSRLVERLDTIVLGLIEALDADKADLPQLLNEALRGSLWSRQIPREGEKMVHDHCGILLTRANVIWKATSSQSRRGYFAMGVGLEAGLRIDAMAEELNALIDKADLAAIQGDADALAEALTALAERLLAMRPFVPSGRNPLPDDWRTILRQWVSGAEVAEIGPQHMRFVEEAFVYRLVWALEAIRVRRLTPGQTPDLVTGGGAAALETGVPRLMMSMLIRAGLPSRQAAIEAVQSTDASFVSLAGMRAWLETDEIAILTGRGDWPTPDTAALWARFRQDALAGGTRKWSVTTFNGRLETAPEATAPGSLHRIVTEADAEGRTWLATPDYKFVAPFAEPISAPEGTLLSGRALGGSGTVEVLRMGPEEAG